MELRQNCDHGKVPAQFLPLLWDTLLQEHLKVLLETFAWTIFARVEQLGLPLIPAGQDPETGHLLATSPQGCNWKTDRNYAVIAFWLCENYVLGYTHVEFVWDSLQGKATPCLWSARSSHLGDGSALLCWVFPLEAAPGTGLYARGVRASLGNDGQ